MKPRDRPQIVGPPVAHGLGYPVDQAQRRTGRGTSQHRGASVGLERGHPLSFARVLMAQWCMRFVIYGAGAIGGLVGARLFQHGHDVTLIARGEHAHALRSGLVVEDPTTTVTLKMPVETTPAAVGWHDDTVVLLCVKSHDTDTAIRDLSVTAPPSTPVVCMQNGVENERRVQRYFTNTYGAVVMCPATHLRPGVVVAHSAPITGLLDVGRYPAGVDAVALSLADAIDATSFSSLPRGDIMRWKYRKLLTNLANAVEALCGPAARLSPVAQAAEREGAEVLAAAGIDVATIEEDRVRRSDHLRTATNGSTTWRGGSSWQSLAGAPGRSRPTS